MNFRVVASALIVGSLSIFSQHVSAQVIKEWPLHGSWQVRLQQEYQSTERNCYLRNDADYERGNQDRKQLKQGTDMGAVFEMGVDPANLPNLDSNATVKIGFGHKTISGKVSQGIRAYGRVTADMMPDDAIALKKFLFQPKSHFVVNGHPIDILMNDPTALRMELTACLKTMDVDG